MVLAFGYGGGNVLIVSRTVNDALDFVVHNERTRKQAGMSAVVRIGGLWHHLQPLPVLDYEASDEVTVRATGLTLVHPGNRSENETISQALDDANCEPRIGPSDAASPTVVSADVQLPFHHALTIILVLTVLPLVERMP